MKKLQLMGCNEGTERLISQEDTLRGALFTFLTHNLCDMREVEEKENLGFVTI